jgi:hypothetical protein
MIAAWIAIGSAFLGSMRDDDPVAAPLSVLIGSGVTSFYLLFSAGRRT